MKDLSAKRIINILPLEPNEKKDLLSRLESSDVDSKFRLERIIWDAYYEIFESQFDKNLSDALEKVKRGEIKLDPDLQKTIQAQTEKELEKEILESNTTELADVREKLQSIINNSVNAS